MGFLLDSGSSEHLLGSLPERDVDALRGVDVGERTADALLPVTLEASAQGVLLHTVEHGPQVIGEVLLTVSREQQAGVDIRRRTPTRSLARDGEGHSPIVVERGLAHLVDVVRNSRDERVHVQDGIGHRLHREAHVTLAERAEVERLDDQTVRADQREQASSHLERGRAVAGVGDEDARMHHRPGLARILNERRGVPTLELDAVLLVTGITAVALGLHRVDHTPAESIELVDHIVRGDEGVAIRHAVRGLGSEDGRSELRNLAFVHEGNHAAIIERKARIARKKGEKLIVLSPWYIST